MPGRSARRTAVVLSALVAATVLSAAPAHADHVGMIARDGSRCVLGEWALGPSGPGLKLLTEKAAIEIDAATGDMTYTCHFVLPAYVAPADHFFGREWYLPTRAVTYNVTCWPPTYPREAMMSTEASFVITPSGKGVLKCLFVDFMSRTMDPTFPN